MRLSRLTTKAHFRVIFTVITAAATEHNTKKAQLRNTDYAKVCFVQKQIKNWKKSEAERMMFGNDKKRKQNERLQELYWATKRMHVSLNGASQR